VKDFYSNLALGLGLTLLAWLITLAMQKLVQVMDNPVERSSHYNPTPKSGGICIVVTFLIGMVLIYIYAEPNIINQTYMIGFVLLSLIVAVISFIDDVTERTARFKLITHSVIIAITLWSGIVIDVVALPTIGYTNLSWLAYPVSFMWILGLTNAFNFMDGIDGIAAGTAAIAALFFMLITFIQGSLFVHITCYAIVAGSLGFLISNFPPAKIFMGDVGSAFLGFVFATLAIIAARYDQSHTSFLVMPMLLFHFIFDTGFTFVRRLIAGENVAQAHRSHLYQLMNRLGYSHMEVTLTYYTAGFLQGIGALLLIHVPGDERVFLFLPFLVIHSLFAWRIVRRSRIAGLI